MVRQKLAKLTSFHRRFESTPPTPPDKSKQASLAGMRGEWRSELTALRDELTHRRRLAAAALKSRREEEDIKVRWGWVAAGWRYDGCDWRQLGSQAWACPDFCSNL